jgi:hypothetical protein
MKIFHFGYLITICLLLSACSGEKSVQVQALEQVSSNKLGEGKLGEMTLGDSET